MKKNFILSCLFFAVLVTNAQINFDSLNRVVDTTVSVRRKIDKFYFGSENKKLSTKEIKIFRDKFMEIAGKSGKKDDRAFAYYKTAWVYYYQFKYNEALVEYFEMLKIAEELKDSTLLVLAHADIGDTYIRLKNRDYALKHFHYGMPYVNYNNKLHLHALNDMYNNLNSVYLNKEKYDSALKYCKLRVELNEKRKMKSLIGRSYSAMAFVYMSMKKNKEAILNYEKALAILQEVHDKKGESRAQMDMGTLLMNEKKYDKAIPPLKRAVELAYFSRFSSKYYITSIFALSDCYYKMGDFKNASEQFMKYKQTNDSIETEDVKQAISELSAKYESEKKDTELALKGEQIKSTKAENTKQKILIIASVIALLASLLAIFFVYRSFRLSKKNAIQLAFKNEVIEEKNKEITDSINYAKLIQQSLLASKEMLDKNLGTDYFILYKPKDIVSGDFYWAAELPSRFLIAAVDCTGHGVPGAFMSLIGKENLDKALTKFQKPGEILSELNRGVKRSLNQNNNSSKDGMDAALVSINRVGEQRKINYAGANRPLLVVKGKDKALTEIKATKQAVGGFTADVQIFEEHELILEKGDVVYICTDGFADQFGSDNNKKMTTKRFKEVLISLSALSCEKQKEELEDFFTKWKGPTEQLDDLLVIGIRL